MSPRRRRGRGPRFNLGFLLPSAAPNAKVCHSAGVAGLATICDDVSKRAHASTAVGLISQARSAQIARLLDRIFGDGLKRSRMLGEHVDSTKVCWTASRRPG